jgi:hypothetical protein
MEIINAKIRETYLGFEDHGIMICFLRLEFGEHNNLLQSFGGYPFSRLIDGKITGESYAMDFIIKILKTLDIDNWESLKGEYIRIKADRLKVHAIGHIAKDQWFNPKKDLNFTPDS